MLHRNETIGLLKSRLDAHTMGLHAVTALLEECGYRVIAAPDYIEEAGERIHLESRADRIVDWVIENNIRHIGISYRLDESDAISILFRLVGCLENADLLNQSRDNSVKSLYFSGIKKVCDRVDEELNGRFITFRGGESAEDTLLRLGVPTEEIPRHIADGCRYDKERIEFGERLINREEYKNVKPLSRKFYKEFGSTKDTLLARLEYNFEGGFQPLVRAHSGPYSAEIPREECIMQYLDWCKRLAGAGYLDILSIGSSQLSQSNFGEDWSGKTNGGGVPVNSENEYRAIWQAAKPMLVRTYSGTKNVCALAAMYERSINMAWHALSLWWFNEIDGRGPNPLYDNLKEHIAALKYIASVGKPAEANVSHHFAFRGSDDITYIVSAYLAAKLAKICGIKLFVLQNMLNTPRATWGLQDLAKSMALLKVVKSLEDTQFRVLLQTRTGLDYFKPDAYEAKVQLAAATALMDDIDPLNTYSPEIIHVVSYSEALCLATPEILNESIKITRQALRDYRELRSRGTTYEVLTEDIGDREEMLVKSSWNVIKAMEEYIPQLYSAEGLYIAFTAGWLPVPELWNRSEEYRYARNWRTKMHNGGVWLYENNRPMSISRRINKAVGNIAEAEYLIGQKDFSKVR